jgi:lysozyme
MTTRTPRKPLRQLLPAACVAILCANVPNFEGMILRGYADPIGIVTACAGHTKTAILGRPYTEEECAVLLELDLAEHAAGVLACVPALQHRVGPLAASVSFAFNVGVRAFCTSTMARLLTAGDIAAACEQLPRWIHAGGQVLPGLVKRRQVEREICLMDFAT